MLHEMIRRKPFGPLAFLPVAPCLAIFPQYIVSLNQKARCGTNYSQGLCLLNFFRTAVSVNQGLAWDHIELGESELEMIQRFSLFENYHVSFQYHRSCRISDELFPTSIAFLSFSRAWCFHGGIRGYGCLLDTCFLGNLQLAGMAICIC